MDYETTTMEEPIVDTDETIEISEPSVEPIVAVPSSKHETHGACDVRRKIEDILENKRYRNEQGDDDF